MSRHLLSLVLAALLLAAALPVRAAAPAPTLQLRFAEKQLLWTAADLARLPRRELRAPDPHTKVEHTYAGVDATALLAALDAPLGDRLRGPALAHAVVVRASDGYAVVFGLAEFDAAFANRTVLLVDAVDGQPLPDGQGPWRLVVAGDQRAARWVRLVNSIEIIALRPTAPPSSP